MLILGHKPYFERLLIKTVGLKEERIIKRKTERLDFTIKCGIHGIGSTRIRICSDAIYIGFVKIKLSELKTICILKCVRRKGSRTISGRYKYQLVFRGEKFINNIGIDITYLSLIDCEKISKLFDYFVFSNEVNSYKFGSKEYVPIIVESKTNINTNIINQYTDEKIIVQTAKLKTKEALYRRPLHIAGDEFDYDIKEVICGEEEQDSTYELKQMCVNDKNYILISVLPLKYSKKFYNKDFLIYKSKFVNENYVDIWCEEDKAKGLLEIPLTVDNNLDVFLVYVIVVIFIMWIVCKLF